MVKLIARLMWCLPVLLAVIALALTRAGFEQRRTFEEGEAARARIVAVQVENRAEVTYGEVVLQIPLADGQTLERTLPLPLSLLNAIRDQETLAVRVRPGGPQEVMIADIARPQWRMSFIHAIMAGIGAVGLLGGVGAWNRYLNRYGDPGAAA